ncbi:MAG: DUF4384 domain-containing protein [Deltaproteobacteria bacterium]|jgi:hypothetical protein|nr:DUF4384 domain-containing protein [Deltaproteobacteria bacterium]MBW2536781.1 DUF4384 domain-containing protein [Deltaproteobacteria bacterium]
MVRLEEGWKWFVMASAGPAMAACGELPPAVQAPEPTPVVAAATHDSSPTTNAPLRPVTQEAPVKLRVTLWSDPKGGAEPAPVAPGQVLHTDDEVWFVVTVNRPAFVYLVAYEPEDVHLVMYPTDGLMQICPDAPTRLPIDPGQHFRLNEATGIENPYVIASVEPLRQPTRVVERLLGTVHTSPPSQGAMPARGTSAEPPQMPVPVPTPLSSCPKPAGLTLWEPSPGAFGGPGLGVVHLPFRHD